MQKAKIKQRVEKVWESAANVEQYRFRPVSLHQHSALDSIGTVQSYGKSLESKQNIVKIWESIQRWVKSR